MSLYTCAECWLPPLAWHAGSGYCLKHAESLRLVIATAPVSSARRLTSSGFERRTAAQGRKMLERKMTALQNELQNAGYWDETPQDDEAMLEKSEERFEPLFPYTSLNGEPRATPF